MLIVLYRQGEPEIYNGPPEWFPFFQYSSDFDDGLLYVGY